MIELRLPGLYNVYNAVAAASTALASARRSTRSAGLERFGAAFGRFERIAAGGKSIVLLLIKNPAGANEVVRTLETGVPPVLVVALNDAIADGRDVSWIWDVDFEPLLEHVGLVIATGERAAELGLRMTYGGLPAERLEVIPSLERRPRPRARARRGRHASWSCSRRTRPCSRCARSWANAVRVRPYWESAAMRIRVGHLYPEYLNIYADRGNIAVLARRAALRGHELEVRAVGVGQELDPGAYDLLYVGGGQDREQLLIAPDLAAKGEALRAAQERGVALLAVCGGYQLLGRGYRGRDGSFMPGAALFPHETVAGEVRMIGDVLLACELDPGERRQLAGFENHAGRTLLDAGATPLGRVVHGFGNDGASGFEGCRLGNASGRTSTARCFLETRGWPTGCSLGRSRTGVRTGRALLSPLPDELEAEAFRVAAERARRRGGRR